MAEDAEQLHAGRHGGAEIGTLGGVEEKQNDSPRRMNIDRQGRQQVELFAAARSTDFREDRLCSLQTVALEPRTVGTQIYPKSSSLTENS